MDFSDALDCDDGATIANGITLGGDSIEHHDDLNAPVSLIRDEEENNTPHLDNRDAVIAAAVADFDADEPDEENDEDDTVNVIIKPISKTGVYKTGATYQARSISHITQHQKPRQGIELDDPGDINNVPTLEFNLSTLGDEEKLWKKPGADITDYFNYGFTEETWVQYCEKQRILRQEYANTTLKPVLNSGGANLSQRIRTGTVTSNVRTFDNFKQASINVVNSGRINNTSLLPSSKLASSNSDQSIGLLGNTTNNSTSLMGQFNQPPPGYLGNNQQSSGNSTTNGVFNIQPIAFPASATSQIMNVANQNAAALFTNLAVPPPVVNNLGGWNSTNLSLSGLMGSGDMSVDPATGQIGSIMEHRDRSPGSGYSNEAPVPRRGRNRYYQDELNYYERDGYRSRRRSHSGSREHYHSKRRPRESSNSRDLDRRSGGSRYTRRSRERDEHVVELPATGSSAHRSTEHRSDRERDRHGRDRGRLDRSRHHGDRHERERSTRHSGHYSSRRKEAPSPPIQSPQRITNGSPNVQNSPIVDPLSAAAAAAANIAAALGRNS